MDFLLLLFFIILTIVVVIYFIRIPYIIAKSRGIAGKDLKTISFLCWISLLTGTLTWIVALVFALLCSSDRSTLKTGPDSSTKSLIELSHLYEKGLLSKEEFEAQKERLYRQQV